MNWLEVLGVLLWCTVAAAGQPCHDDTTCFDNHFCDPQADYSCRPCLSCKLLNREEPALKTTCVKSVRECGPCLKDLVSSQAGDLSCVPRASSAPKVDSGDAVWIAAGVAIVVFVVVAVALLVRYLFKNTNIFKMHLDTNIATRTLSKHVPSAPELPPPYSPQGPVGRPGQDTELPLIDRRQLRTPDVKTTNPQRAFAYEPPSYVRLPTPEGNNNVPVHYHAGHDDDTTPSPWQPGNDHTVNIPEENGTGRAPDAAGDVSVNTSTNLSAGLALARSTSLIQTPQITHTMHLVSDGESPDEDARAHEPPPRTQRDGNSNVNIMNVNQFFVMKPPI